MFTRQHYKAIAGILKNEIYDATRPEFENKTTKSVRYHRNRIATRLADEVFVPDNERFDREKFLEACGVTK